MVTIPGSDGVAPSRFCVLGGSTTIPVSFDLEDCLRHICFCQTLKSNFVHGCLYCETFGEHANAFGVTAGGAVVFAVSLIPSSSKLMRRGRPSATYCLLRHAHPNCGIRETVIMFMRRRRPIKYMLGT